MRLFVAIVSAFEKEVPGYASYSVASFVIRVYNDDETVVRQYALEHVKGSTLPDYKFHRHVVTLVEISLEAAQELVDNPPGEELISVDEEIWGVVGI